MIGRFIVSVTLVYALAYATASRAAEFKLNCVCIAATSLCNFARFDEAAGKPRLEWSQPIFGDDSPPAANERALACWRKRDVGGQGLCCSLNSDESDATRYFKGDVQN